MSRRSSRRGSGGSFDDGLINPDAFPAKSANLHVLEITSSAATLRAMGNAVEDKTATVKTTWDRLTGCYQAPEQEQVYAVMTPAVTSAADLKARFAQAARHLDEYAGALEVIKPRLADLERRARAFRASVINGVWVDASESANASFGDHARWAFDWVPGVDEERVKVPWREDAGSLERNTDLLEEYAQILADVSAAVATCANAVNGLLTGVCVAPVEAIPAAAFTSAEAPMPWGSPATEDRNCVESVGAGAREFGTSMRDGAGMLIVGYNPQTGDWWDSDAYGQAWGGLGDLAGSLLVMSTPVGWVGTGLSAAGVNNGFTDWTYDRAITVRDAGGSLIGWDPNAEDGWHAWREDGVAAATGAVLNVGTFFIPGAGEVGAGLKAGSVTARVARIAGVGAEFAVQGGSWVVRGAVRLVTGLEAAVTRFNLDDMLRNLHPGQMLDATTGARLSPGGLLGAMTDASHAAPGVVPHTPVGDSLFNPHAPDITTPHTPTIDTPHTPDAPHVPDTPHVPDAPHTGGTPHAGDTTHPAAPDTPPGTGEHGAPGGKDTPGHDGGTGDSSHPDGGHDPSPDGVPEELGGLDQADPAHAEAVLDDMVDQAADVTDAATFDAIAAEKIGLFERLASRYDEGAFMRRLFEGSAFNWENYHRYEFREVLLEHVIDPGPPPVTERFRVDSYTPGEAVVSRKLTQLADVQPRTAIGYIDELLRKYNPTNQDLRVMGTDANRAQFGNQAGDLVGDVLHGQMVLEVPVQTHPIPVEVLEYADRKGVLIRDVTGTEYLP